MALGFQRKSLDEILAGPPKRAGRTEPHPLRDGPIPLWAIAGEEPPIGWELRNAEQHGETPAVMAQLAPGDSPATMGQKPESGSTSAAYRLTPIDLPGMGTTYVDSSIAPNIQQFLKLNQEGGIPATFNEGFRSTQDQVSMRENPNAITPAAPGMSLHEAGRAFDINWNDLSDTQQRALLRNANQAGLSWGGRFRTPDKPHFFIEVPGGLKARRSYIEGMKEEFRRMQASPDQTP